MGPEYYVGTSGWSYPHWQSIFYPQELAQRRWLEFYSHHFPSVELNASFYRLPTERAFEQWRDTVSEGFRFAVKASRFITHVKRLREAAEPLETFLERARILGDKLGPILYQLPPSMGRDEERLETFLALLPAGVQHAFEFRNTSWYHEKVFDLLHRFGVAFCIHDMGRLETPVVATAEFAYIRFHGPTGRYSGCYSDQQLERWAKTIRKMRLKSVYVYFNNDIGGYAVTNAATLVEMLAKE